MCAPRTTAYAHANSSAVSSNTSGTHSAATRKPRHRGEDDEPDDALLRVHDAGEPGVADPAPPQHAEHEHPLREPLPRRRVGHQRRALGEREDEDEVEEQLERRDALAPAHHRGDARRAARRGGAHPGHVARLLSRGSDRSS
jgi:hypothetical protein